MVLQDTWMFAGTIHDNIAYGRPGASDAEVVDAAKAAHVDGFVRTLPEGYATVLDEDASNLSSGQNNCSPSRAPSSPTRASSSSTRPPATSTPAPRSSSKRPWRACARVAPAS